MFSRFIRRIKILMQIITSENTELDISNFRWSTPIQCYKLVLIQQESQQNTLYMKFRG